MSESTQGSTQPEIVPTQVAEAFPGQAWLLKNWARVRLGHEGIMLDRINRNQKCVEVLARNAMTGDMQNTKGWPTEEEGDDMGVNIGDHVHYHGPNQAEPKPQKSSLPNQAEPKPQKSSLLPILLLAGAALAVGGIPFNGRTLLQHVMGAALSPVEAFHDTDTDTTIGLGSIDELKSDK